MRRADRAQARSAGESAEIDADIHTAALPQYLAAAYLTGDRHAELLRTSLPVYRARRDALVLALERHLGHDATWTVPQGGNHIWVTLRDAVDERALYVEALRAGTAFLPGGAITAEKSSRTSMRLSFGLVEPDLLDEGVRRLAIALREVRGAGGWGRRARCRSRDMLRGVSCAGSRGPVLMWAKRHL